MPCDISEFTPVSRDLLKLPECPIPRPGDTVCWYAGSQLVKGELRGHDRDGRPLVINEFGNPSTKDSFDAIRLLNPFDRRAPNWAYLSASSKILRPPEHVRERFKEFLRCHIPPGPRPIDLAREIWNRGFEVYLVGGTVRDLLAGHTANDIDLVTTMPLVRCVQITKAMFGFDPSVEKREKGVLCVGGAKDSGDPSIDIKVFSSCLPGTEDAMFGVGFAEDVSHRDFACNAVYYDPINEVLVDPCGRGVEDCANALLDLILIGGDPGQHAQVLLRFFMFICRGFAPTPATRSAMLTAYAGSFEAMKKQTRIHFFREKVLRKAARLDEKRPLFDQFGSHMKAFGMESIWEKHVAPYWEEISNES